LEVALRIIAVTTALLIASTTAPFAGPFSDRLTVCMIDHMSPADNSALARWMVAALAVHPAVSGTVSVQPSQGEAAHKGMADLVNRLFLEDCLSDLRLAVRSEGETAAVDAFKFVAQAATRELLGHPDVASEVDKMAGMLDVDRLNAELLR